MLKKVIILVGAALIGFFSVTYMSHAEEKATAPPGGAMPVSVSAALSRDVTEWTEYSGRLRAAEDVQINPRVSGTIDAVHFKEGDIVKKGDPLFTIDPRPYAAALAQAEAQVEAASAAVELASSERSRAKKLLDEKALSQKEFDQRSNAAKSASANLKLAKAQRDMAALNVEYAAIRAPIGGRVGRPDITVGNTVEQGRQVLTTIQSLNPVYADFDMDEATYLRTMKQARGGNRESEMPVFMALADETDFSRQGKIRSFDNQLSGNSGTLRVRAEFDNTDGFLTPGLFARIRLGGAAPKKAVLINDSAIGTDQDRKFVYVVDDKGMVGYRPVTPGALSDGLRVIIAGLAVGENIIVNGLMRVHPGMPVQPVMVDMTTLKGPDDKTPPPVPTEEKK